MAATQAMRAFTVCMWARARIMCRYYVCVCVSVCVCVCVRARARDSLQRISHSNPPVMIWGFLLSGGELSGSELSYIQFRYTPTPSTGFQPTCGHARKEDRPVDIWTMQGAGSPDPFRVEELCKSQGGCPGLPVSKRSLTVSVEVKQH